MSQDVKNVNKRIDFMILKKNIGMLHIEEIGWAAFANYNAIQKWERLKIT